MEGIMTPGDHRKPCCKNPLNLAPFQVRKDLVIRRCNLCGCRHFELTIEPGQLGLKFSLVG